MFYGGRHLFTSVKSFDAFPPFFDPGHWSLARTPFHQAFIVCSPSLEVSCACYLTTGETLSNQTWFSTMVLKQGIKAIWLPGEVFMPKSVTL